MFALQQVLRIFKKKLDREMVDNKTIIIFGNNLMRKHTMKNMPYKTEKKKLIHVQEKKAHFMVPT